MWKKLLLATAALILMLSANLNVCWEISVNRRLLPGLYSASQIARCSEAADRAAEELLRGSQSPPLLLKSCRLSLRPAGGSERLLTHRLLMGTGGICRSYAVIAGGTPLGTVSDGRELLKELRAFIKNQMPNAAAFGGISGSLKIIPCCSTPGRETPCGDMVLLISGVTPVFYVDSRGLPA